MTCSLINEDVKSMTKIQLYSSACLRRNFPNFSTNLDFEFYCRVCCGLHTRSLRCHHKKKSNGLNFRRMPNICGFKRNKVSIKCLMQPISNMLGGLQRQIILWKPDFLWINSSFKITGTVKCQSFIIFKAKKAQLPLLTHSSLNSYFFTM